MQTSILQDLSAIPSSAKQVVNFIKEHFTKTYTSSAVISLLHRLNFAYKKPRLVPGKANAENQESFLKELKMLKEQLSETDQLVYIDGVHPQHNSKPSCRFHKCAIYHKFILVCIQIKSFMYKYFYAKDNISL